MKRLPFHQVDAFTSDAFGGNPAAVLALESPLSDERMQDIAMEMNLSETAFVLRVGHGDGTPGSPWSLRWFTPAAEVELCGHATLAAAHALYTTGRADPDHPIRFATRVSGVLTSRRTAGGAIAMDFPADPPAELTVTDALLDALGGAGVLRAARCRHFTIAELPDAAAVRALTPDLAKVARLEGWGVAVTAPGGADAIDARDASRRADMVSRFFAPRVRINEDPVTGSMHCGLAPYWAERLGRSELLGYQASGRGGWVGMRLLGDRVELSGDAVTVLTAELHAPPPAEASAG